MPKSKQAILILLCTVFVSTALLAAPYTPAKIVRTTTVERGDLMQSVLVSGVVAYQHQQFCVSLQPGIVQKVHVQPGQRVKKGEKLFEMDTSMQQAILEGLYAMKYGLEEGKWKLLTAQQQWEWAQTEADVLRSIDQSCIRATQDGLVEAVYVTEGTYADAGALLGGVRDTDKCVVATARMADLQGVSPGSAALLEDVNAAVVGEMRAPEENGMQQLVLLPVETATLEKREAGERLTAELVRKVVRGCALIPLSAVDEEGHVWYMEDGFAHSQEIDLACRSAQAVAVDESWLGRRVILIPEGLQNGCRVKEAAAR